MQLWPVDVIKKVFNWSELHLSDVISYKIHTLINTFLDFLALKWPFIGQPLVISLVPYNLPIFKSNFFVGSIPIHENQTQLLWLPQVPAQKVLG